jgi:hypothetical protein
MPCRPPLHVLQAEHSKLICSVRFFTGFVASQAVVFKRWVGV